MSTNSLFGTRPRPAFIYELDVNGFIQSLETALTNLTAGYSLRLHQNGSTIATVDWNWAKEPQDTSESWTPDVRMHVASLSKIVTAIAMTKLLNEKSVSYDTPIIDYLPAYWSKGPNVNKITFAELHLNPPDYGLLPSAPCRGNGSTVKCITDNQAVLLRAPEFEDGGRKCRIRKKFIHAYRNQKSSFKPVESDHFQIGPRSYASPKTCQRQSKLRLENWPCFALLPLSFANFNHPQSHGSRLSSHPHAQPV